MKTNGSRRAFTFLELLIILLVVAIIAGFLLPAFGPLFPPRASRIKCVNNLKNIGLAFRIYATDNGDQFPGGIMLSNGVDPAKINILRIYLNVSNELSTPKILLCPDDVKRQAAETFTNMQIKNLSYFMSLNASETSPETLLAGDRNLQTNNVPIPAGLFALTGEAALGFTAEIHKGEGNFVMGDGSVQQFSNERLQGATNSQGIATNLLVIP